MHAVSKFSSSSILVLACLAGLGCGSAGLDPTAFIVRIDSMSVPDAIAATDTLVVRFWGKLGPDLCSRLDRVETARGPGMLDVTFHGERSVRGECLQMPAALTHEERILPPMQNPFTIRVMQPDGTALVESVHVQ